MKYKLFGAHTGLPVSEIALGSASLGTRRGYGASAQEIPKLLSAYTEAGGNLIDLADQYQYGEAEEIIGKFVEGRRHNFVLCTKYTRSSEANPYPANEGNGRKVMHSAVEPSLRRLKTDYIDIYMPHYDDGRTPPEETARGLEDLIKAGKIIYAGLANFPAWKAAAIASQVPVTALQIEYNLAQRTADQERLPMATHFGLGVMLYSPLAGGLLTGKYRSGENGRLTLSAPDGYKEDILTKTIIDELERIAIEVEAIPAQVALAWTLTKGGFPIVGARSLAQLQESLGALSIPLNSEQLSRLDKVSAVSMGYPQQLLSTVQKVY